MGTTLLFILIIVFLMSLTVLIIFGRILAKINGSSCHSTSDEIKDAHKWAAWGVGISAALTAVSLGGIIFMFF